MASNYNGEGSEELQNFKTLIKKALDGHVPLDTILQTCLNGTYTNIYRHVCDHGGEKYAKQTIADLINIPVNLIWPPRDQPTNGGGGEAPDCAAFYREHNSRRR